MFCYSAGVKVARSASSYSFALHRLFKNEVHLGSVDATIFISMRVEVLDGVATSHFIVTNRVLFAEFEVRCESLIDWIASGNFDILHNSLSIFYKFVYLSLFYDVSYFRKLVIWLAHRGVYDVASNLVIA
ncbi:unnamed protein product [Eruca vesicaria subsp. sativa]|uniref:Uncharacterized protein n=1 Tax=Eruca vesicaria subsp. sativa TaxID=29727 RepID=A0ABC8M8L6_ERUVS|nr:unnamed protein product [Eruca vesicaria subsp. sativa]